jgi:outer membrane protein W
MATPFSNLATTQSTGGFGEVGAFVLVQNNIGVRLDYAYYYFPGRLNTKGNLIAIPLQEVMISGIYFFKLRLNPNIAFGLSYYGEPSTSHFGYVPSIGIMPRINDYIFLNAKFSVSFFNMDGNFFKIGAGVIFKVFQHKPIRNY